MTESADRDAPPSADELRRRVYRPDATAADVAAYESALAAERAAARSADRVPDDEPAETESEAEADTAEPAPPGRARRRALLACTAVLALAVLVVAGIASARAPAPHAPVASPTPLAVDAFGRTAFVRALAQGGAAGIGGYLDAHPGSRPPALRTATHSETVERTGTGTGTVVLDPGTQSAADGGRATVVLVLAARARAGWAAYRFVLDADHSVRRRLVAQRAGAQSAGAPTSGTFSFAAGERPVRLRITAPAGTRWGVAVVFTDCVEPAGAASGAGGADCRA